MRSIEDLTDAIRNQTSAVQFREAIRAYSAGAYRAATLLLWTAVMQDLTDKLRVLADAGDGAAITAVKEVDSARQARDVRRMQSFENGLLERAEREFEFLTAREKEELSRLKDDRNLCAHPSFRDDAEAPFEITGEQVRAYARLVVDSVLSQPPIVGKALVDRFKADVQSDSWPEELLADFLRTRYFDRARKGAKRSIIVVATKAAINPPGASNRVAGRCVATIKAATQIDEILVLDAVSETVGRLRDHLNDTELIRVCGAIGDLRTTWDSLGADNVTRTKTLLSCSPTEMLIEERAFASGPPVEESLHKCYLQAIGRLSDEQLDSMTRKPYPKSQWVPRVLEQVRSAYNYREGERTMRMALRVAESLTPEQLEDLADAFVANNQINRASDVPQLIERLIEDTASISNSRATWKTALSKYQVSYDPDSDPSGYYSYSEARRALGV